MRRTSNNHSRQFSDSWAEQTAKYLCGKDQSGVWLLLGAADTGKTTLVSALAECAVHRKTVGIVDADVGQSHIGPPTTVGWAFVKAARDSWADKPSDVQVELSELPASGISFVGDVTPVGHLLPLTAAIAQCVQQASASADLVIIDTPGFISGPGANTLWWTIHHILRPNLTLALARGNELDEILAGLKQPDHLLEIIVPPMSLRSKSPDQRRQYRQERFKRYFDGAGQQVIDLNNIAVQAGRDFEGRGMAQRLIALRDEHGVDQALGVVVDWNRDGKSVAVLCPAIDTRQTRCLVVGDVYIDCI